MTIFNDIQEKCTELSNSIQKLAISGQRYAEAYRTYRILLSKELLKLKAAKMPVTIAYDIARGIDQVANAKFNEIVTETIYKANLENVQVLKLQIKILQNQYDKEYSIAGKYNEF